MVATLTKLEGRLLKKDEDATVETTPKPIMTLIYKPLRKQLSLRPSHEPSHPHSKPQI